MLSNNDNLLLNRQEFADITRLVIQQLEGGYFHPKMLKDGRLSDPKGLYSGIDKDGNKVPGITPSGETIGGIDRVRGLEYRTNAVNSWDELFGILDTINAADKWKHNSFGPKTDKDYAKRKARIEELVGYIIYAQFNKFASLYLDDKSYEIIKQSPELIAHFSYATWNGQGWFRKYSERLIGWINEGYTDPSVLAEKSINLRINEGFKKNSKPNILIKQGGIKIRDIIVPILRKNPIISKTPTEINNQTVTDQTKTNTLQTETELCKDINSSETKTKVTPNKLNIPEPTDENILKPTIERASSTDTYLMPNGVRYKYRDLIRAYPSLKDPRAFQRNFNKLPPLESEFLDENNIPTF